MKKIKITWVFCGYMAFRDDEYDESYRAKYLKMLEDEGVAIKPDVSLEFEFDFHKYLSDHDIAEHVFMNTNTYSGAVWYAIEKLLPTNRSHTALSMGDLVEIDGRVYRCEAVGFKKLEMAG